VFEGFTLEYVDVGELTLRVGRGSDGQPVVLLHGHPRTHTTWHRLKTLRVSNINGDYYNHND
jgi:haloacetate dehalogenase